MIDKFNAVETAVVAFLAANSDLTAEINKFEEKLRPDVQNYNSHELPACAVQVLRYNNREYTGRIAVLETVIEITSRGGDFAVLDNTVKRIASLVVDKIRAENPENGGGAINDIADQIDVSSVDFIPDNLDNEFTLSALITIEIGIIER